MVDGSRDCHLRVTLAFTHMSTWVYVYLHTQENPHINGVVKLTINWALLYLDRYQQWLKMAVRRSCLSVSDP